MSSYRLIALHTLRAALLLALAALLILVVLPGAIAAQASVR
jgi:hypothetical protein